MTKAQDKAGADALTDVVYLSGPDGGVVVLPASTVLYIQNDTPKKGAGLIGIGTAAGLLFVKETMEEACKLLGWAPPPADA